MKFTIALIQSSCTADPITNTDKTIAHIREAARMGANIICTQELFRSQYFCQHEDPANFDLAEPIPGPTTTTLSTIAKELNIAIIASLFEKRATGLYHNTAAILDADGSLLGTYRKMHIPDDPAYYEKYYFTPGDAPGFKIFQTQFAKIGVLICWDQWYPEAARLTALQDCSILFYPTAIGWHPREQGSLGPSQTDAWTTMHRAHAIANGIYVAAPNRVGFEKPTGTPGEGLIFWGNSLIIDPFGRQLATASNDKEEILIAEIDPALQEQTRRLWPFLRDRRIDAYGAITQRFAK